MCKNLYSHILFCIILFTTSCGYFSSSKSATCHDTTMVAKDMKDFAKDEEFKNAHELKADIPFEPKGTMMEFASTDGKKGSAYLLKASESSPEYLFVIHEWWGLNNHIKQEAERLQADLGGNINVMALDLYDGKVATNREDAGKYMGATTEERGNAIIQGAINYAGKEAKIATIGWCFGGGWSLKSSILAGEQGAGCVIYYGMPLQEADKLKPLKADVLGIFAEKDGWITPKVVNDFKETATGIGKKVEVHQFDADHAFANPSSERYNAEAATKANALALTFLKERL
ncbi:MAG: dienelactone hydrolase family protein [Chitinophagales bacterium]